MKRLVLLIVIGVVFICSFISFIYLIAYKNREKDSSAAITTATKLISLEDLVGQRFIWGITEATLSTQSAGLITKTHAGGVILMGELTRSQISSMTAQIQSLPHTLPYIIAIDQEGGTVKRMIDDENPGGTALGKLNDSEFCQTIASTSAKLANGGINTNFGIIGDIGWYPNAYIANRTYGNTLDSVRQKTLLAIQCSKPIKTTIKHFPGHGRTLLNSHLMIPNIKTSFDEWIKTDAQPFFASIVQGVDFIMFGHLRYESIASEPASLSPFFHSFVKDRGFTGMTITDDMGMLENSDIDPIKSMKQAFDSGNDILLYVTSKVDPHDLFREALLHATSSSDIYSSFVQQYNHIKAFKDDKLKQ